MEVFGSFFYSLGVSKCLPGGCQSETCSPSVDLGLTHVLQTLDNLVHLGQDIS